MLILLSGPDGYRRLQKKRELVAQFLKKHSATGLQEFDFDEGGSAAEALANFAEFTHSQSLFDPVRLAVASNPFAAGEKLTALLKPLLASKELTVILETSEKRILKAFSFLTKEPALHQEFEYLSGAPWKAYIKQYAKSLGLKLDDAALSFLAQVYVGNTWGMITELQMLSSLRTTSSKLLEEDVITQKDLEQFQLEAAPDFWKLINAVKVSDPGRRLAALELVFLQNEAPAKVFNILAALWKERVAQSAEYDFKVKTGKLEYEEALLDLVIQ